MQKTYAIALGCSMLFATALAGCAADGDLNPSRNHDVAPSEGEQDPAISGQLEELRRRRLRCKTEADCPRPGAPCRACDDGSSACPEVSCERNRCVYEFQQCDDSYAPCSEKSCGEQCHQCPRNDPDCIETAVVKLCQADGSCSPQRPSCLDTNPCAAVLCPVDTQCVVSGDPPEASCEPILTNPCAAVLCPVDTQCVVSGDPPEASCEPIVNDPCAAVRCRAGTHCELGQCLPDAAKVFCGGIAAFECPGAGDCVDDPSDSCDPGAGGADCGGMCSCNAIGLCVSGMHWDSSPKVCGCVKDETPKVFCGGIAGIACPGIGQCVDDPSDGCDPNNGGADCGGMCTCEALAKCRGGTHFDSSPGVCTCVPDKPTGPGAQCGKNSCGPGTYCCNESCGICAPRGGACIQIAC
jgi:hypothetical protein